MMGSPVNLISRLENTLIAAALLTRKRKVQSAYWPVSQSSGYRSCKCGAVYDRCEPMVEEREISSFECAVWARSSRIGTLLASISVHCLSS
jgi:hypothetical protein